MITLCLAPPGTGVTHDSRGRHGAASVSNPRPGSGFRVRRRGRAHRRAKGVGETPAWPSVARRGFCCPRERAWLPSLRSCAQHVPSLCSSRKSSSGCKGLESRARVWTPACAGEVTALTLLEPSPRRAGTTLGSLSERLALPQRAAPPRRARPAAPDPRATCPLPRPPRWKALGNSAEPGFERDGSQQGYRRTGGRGPGKVAGKRGAPRAGTHAVPCGGERSRGSGPPLPISWPREFAYGSR